ncbi:MAG: glycosyltransferase family 2 protein [Candidatus Binatia bacterium]
MPKLIIQIPCFNEEQSLPATLADLPRSVPGFDAVETLVIDDGSMDRTSEVAREAGATYLLRFPVHLGLAQAFSAGLDAALKLGADVIVNTDADGQYRGSDVARLVQPIVRGEAEMVIGDRAPARLKHFSPPKRLLQWLGSWVVRQLSGTSVPDATSGFRAFSRRAALRLNVLTKFTYTHETIIQAGKKHIALAHVPIATNPDTRPSRLFGSITAYIRRSVPTLFRIYALYEPFKVFWTLGAALIVLGGVIGLRFLVHYLTGGGSGHIQSLILSAVLLIIGFQMAMFGMVADLIGSTRSLLEDTLFRVREIELAIGGDPEVVRIAGDPDPTPIAARAFGPRGSR